MLTTLCHKGVGVSDQPQTVPDFGTRPFNR